MLNGHHRTLPTQPSALLLFVVLMTAAASLTMSRDAAAQTIVIENATVWVSPDQKLDNASVLIRDGKIAAVGQVVAPSNARRIDGRNKVVTAGFIDASTTLGISEVGMVGSSNDGRFEDNKEPGIHAAYRVADGYNQNSVAIPLARADGVTSIMSLPRGGFIAGIGSAFSLAGSFTKKPAAYEITREVVMVANLGEQAMATNHGSRGLAITQLRAILSDARLYGRSKAAYDRNQSRKLAASRLDLEALQLVLQRRIPLLIRANRASDIAAALRLGKEQRIRIVIEGGVEAWQLAGDLAAAKITVIIEPSKNLPASFDTLHVRDDGASLLAAEGVAVVISTTGDAANVRNLRQLAGIAVARGLAWKDALAAVTTTVASSFTLGNRGSLARGKIADVVVWSGDPFELSTRAEHVIIGGVEQSIKTRQTELFERYRRLPATRR